MSVLAVIPCLNEIKHIETILEQLNADQNIDLIVVADGGSFDGSIEIVQKFIALSKKIRLLNNEKKIQSAGVNLAVKQFGDDYEWLLRVDAHCIYPTKYCKTLLSAAKNLKAGSVVVPMITIGDHGFQSAVAAAQNSILGTGGSAHRHGSEGRFVDHGHHALISIKQFVSAGGYCEAMPCNEDAELDYRMTQNGVKIWLESKAAIEYLPRSTPTALWKQYFKYGIGRASNLQRHRMRPRFRQILPLAVPASVILLILMPLHWVFTTPFSTWITLSLFAGFLIGYKQGGKWKSLSGLAAAIMHLSWGTGFLWQIFRHPGGVAPKYGFTPD